MAILLFFIFEFNFQKYCKYFEIKMVKEKNRMHNEVNIAHKIFDNYHFQKINNNII